MSFYALKIFFWMLGLIAGFLLARFLVSSSRTPSDEDPTDFSDPHMPGGLRQPFAPLRTMARRAVAGVSAASSAAVRLTSTLHRAGAGLWAFLVRWQEHSAWLPLMLGLGVLGWVVFGALDRTAVVDVLVLWVQLPPRAGYAIAALGLTYLARRRWRRKLHEDEQADLWRGMRAGERGAVLIYAGDLAFTLVVLAMLLHHFRVVQ
jgi:hypothetical protein